MVTVLRALLVALATVCLLAAGAWVAADHYATGWVRDGLSDHGLDGLVDIGQVRLPLPGLARATDVDLRDPLTGQIVAHVDQLELHFPSRGLGLLWQPVPEWIVGQGCRVTLSRAAGALTIERAVHDLIERVKARVAASAEEPGDGGRRRLPEGAPLPRIEFRDVAVLLQSPGTALQVVPGCRATIDLLEHATQVNVEAGAAGGSVSLRFAAGGLTVDVRGVAVTPTYALFLPEDGGDLSRLLSPSGRLDLQLEYQAGARFSSGHGLLDDTSLHLRGVPFPIDHARLPFEFGDGRFRVRDARASLQGGMLTTNVDHGAEGTLIGVDVVDARFRRDYLALLPQAERLVWIRPEDGGNVELHVQIADRAGAEHLDIKGWGGVLCDHVRLGPTGVDVEDLVGSFDLHGDRLLLHETSGRVASGVVRLRGQLDLQTGDVEFAGSVFDVDVSRLRGELGPGEAGPSAVTGWLQGEVNYEGNLADPKDGRGKGEFSVRGGNLWKVPVLDRVIAALGVADPGGTERHRLEVRFRVRGLRYTVDEMRLESTVLSLLGSGKVSRAGELDVDIIPISVPFGPIGDLLEYLQAQVVRLELRGTLVDPEVKVVVVKAVTRPLGRLWDFLAGLFGGGDEPVATPDATLTPDATATPDATGTPEPLDAPDATRAPEDTGAPAPGAVSGGPPPGSS